MNRLHFSLFANPMHQRVQELLVPDAIVLRVRTSKEDLWNTYLDAFPAELNGIFRERKHYDGQFDRQFIVRMGALVVLDPKTLKLTSLWSNLDVPGYFKDVANAMDEYIQSCAVEGFHLISENKAGSKPNVDILNPEITWTHFYTEVPAVILDREPTSTKAALQARVDGFKRLAETITEDTLETVIDLCDNVYRGAEFKKSAEAALRFLKAYAKVEYNPLYLYTLAKDNSKQSNGFRNSVIGTLAIDIQEGVDLEKAVASYESKVAPHNYRRTQSVVTPQMIKNAEKEITEQGLMDELYRVPVKNVSELPVNSLLYTYTPAKVTGLFDDLKTEASARPASLDLKKVQDIDYPGFLKLLEEDKPTSVEMYVESVLNSSSMTLFTNSAPFNPETNILNWDNGFTWMYKGGVSDAITERVKAAGGTVNAPFRVSLAWNHGSDYDLGLKTPSGQICYFGNRSTSCGLRLDVDANGGGITNRVDPVENIYTSNPLKDGKYTVRVDMFNLRNAADRNSPFQVQIQIGDEIFTYNADRLFTNARNNFCLEIEMKNNKLVKITNLLPTELHETSSVTTVMHNLNTNTFVPVQAIVKSPNHWDKAVGNEHLFFIMQDMKMEDTLNTFLPEYLNGRLKPIRKAMELISNKLKVELTVDTEQISGFGFSSTLKKSVVVRVMNGSRPRLFKINFGI